MNFLEKIIDLFGIINMPWAARALLFLILVDLILLGFLTYISPNTTISITTTVSSSASEALKLMLTAFLGALTSKSENSKG